MFVKGLSTRHTSVGTFRFGVVYEVDDSNPDIQKHVLPLLDGKNPALKKISKAEAQKDSSASLQFTPGMTAPDANVTNAELRSALKKAEYEGAKVAEDLSRANAELAKVRIDLTNAHADLDEKDNQLTKAQVDLATAKDDLADKDAELTTAQAALVKVQAELTALQSAQGDQTTTAKS